MNILVLVWDNPDATYGGIQTQVNELRRDPVNNNIVRVLPSCNPWLLRAGLAETYLSLSRLREALLDVVDREDIQVVHSHNLHRQNGLGVAEGVVDALTLRSIPHIATVHDFLADVGEEELLRQEKVLRSAFCVATSEFIKNELMNTLAINSVVIPPCIAVPKYIDHVPSPGDTPVVLAPGRVVPHKGLIKALILAGHLSQEFKHLELRMSSVAQAHNGGDEMFTAFLRDTARSFPRLSLKFADKHATPKTIYKGVHLTICLPEAIEGFCLGPLESLGNGIPSLVTINGGMGWMRRYKSICEGVATDMVQLSAIALAMLTDWSSWRQRAANEQGAISKEFSCELVRQRYSDVYRERAGVT